MGKFPNFAKASTPNDPYAIVRTERGYRHRYRVLLPDPLLPWQLELLCWSAKVPTGIDGFTHFRRAAEILVPESKWHDWKETRMRALTDDTHIYKFGNITIRNHSWAGCGGSGKTTDAALYGFLFWLSDPDHSFVILTSTSKTKMRQRAWPCIQEYYNSARNVMDEQGVVGPHMLNSSMELQSSKGDSKHAIFGQAVEQGEVSKAVDNIKGVHADRICLIIDEADSTPTAIYQTIPNMLKGCREFVLINSANGPTTHIDSFSKVCTPAAGWKSVTVEDEEWETAPVPEFQLPGGWCFHFDGKKSPNVRAGKTIFNFLYTWENWTRMSATPEATRTALFWSQDRGFWPPEGFLNTVLTEALIEFGGARGQIQFEGKTTPIGSLDSGFGGDACTLRYGRMGRMKDGKLAVQVDGRIIIHIAVDMVDATGKKVPAEYQILNRVREECNPRGIKPQYFGVESSGTGRGAAAVLTQEWGEVLAIESGGKPSDLPASEEDPRPSHQVYDRRITELYFSVQAFVRNKQLGGLAEDDVIQFCSRLYIISGKKYVLESKDGKDGSASGGLQNNFKARFGRSPDDSDSVSCMVEVARHHGMQTRGPRADRMWNTWTREIDFQAEVYKEENLYQPEEV